METSVLSTEPETAGLSELVVLAQYYENLMSAAEERKDFKAVTRYGDRLDYLEERFDELTGFMQEEALDREEAVGQVYKAWTVEGPSPTHHGQAKAHLKNNWPVLFRALEKLEKTIGKD